MRKLVLFVTPFVLFGCILERHNHHEPGYEWGYYESHHGDRDRHLRGDGVEPCPLDASLAQSVHHPDAGADAATADAGKAKVRCKMDSDCQGKTYCEPDGGACLAAVECKDESACDHGFNCDAQRGVCLPAAQERCSELTDESACAQRSDCQVVYAGINCSCGPDCTCMGKEPNCVCERFEYAACSEPLDAGQPM